MPKSETTTTKSASARAITLDNSSQGHIRWIKAGSIHMEAAWFIARNESTTKTEREYVHWVSRRNYGFIAAKNQRLQYMLAFSTIWVHWEVLL